MFIALNRNIANWSDNIKFVIFSLLWYRPGFHTQYQNVFVSPRAPGVVCTFFGGVFKKIISTRFAHKLIFNTPYSRCLKYRWRGLRDVSLYREIIGSFWMLRRGWNAPDNLVAWVLLDTTHEDVLSPPLTSAGRSTVLFTNRTLPPRDSKYSCDVWMYP